MLFFRVRFLIGVTRTVSPFHPVHHPLVYALLCEAWAKGSGEHPHLPAGVSVIAPEQLRIGLGPGSRYAFGVNILAADVESATMIVQAFRRGLQRLGQEAPAKPQTLAGNFELLKTEDLFGQATLSDDDAVAPLPADSVHQECVALNALSPLVTLNFQTPLRWQFPRAARRPGHRYLDRRHFDASLFLGRLKERLETCGLDTSGAPADLNLTSAEVVDNRLVWIDIDYRNAQRKSRSRRSIKLSGASGSITLRIPEHYPRHWLVWCQYVHVGESTRFGLGAFRIKELGPDRFPCRRSTTLVELGLNATDLQQSALQSGADAAEVTRAAQLISAEKYVPRPPHSVEIESPDTSRSLSIPHAVDMALQRSILKTLAPGLDLLFEESSFAYRRGLGRHRAARAIQQAWEDGYRWAAQADFERFFDSVAHVELEARLRAYVADEPLSRLMMQWVGSCPRLSAVKQGLPTGAPLSPVLANMFLDRFDERIAEQGGRLIRFADDFLILTRDRRSAEKMFETARAAAENLRLTLNRDKARLVDLSSGFDFLGFRFDRQSEWRTVAGQPPIEVERLGWFDASRQRPRYAPRFLLPGETDRPSSVAGTVCVIEPDAQWVGVKNKHLTITTSTQVHKLGPEIDSLSQILILGTATIDESLWRALRRDPVVMLMADDSGRAVMEWFPDDAAVTAEVLAAQVDVSRDDARRLQFARQLIYAKLMNYAALADAVPSQLAKDDTAEQTRQLAVDAMNAESLEQLLGYEGAAAAAWYRTLTHRLPSRFPFYKRIAPKAHDPINVLLNIAHTHLYRQCRIAAKMTGLIPSVGMLHQPRSGHAALASDLQEPFRMLADRAVIEAAWKVEPDDFRDDDRGFFPLTVAPAARRRLLGTLYQSLAQSARAEGAAEPFSFRNHLFRLARSYKTALLNDSTELRVFCCERSGENFNPSAANLRSQQ